MMERLAQCELSKLNERLKKVGAAMLRLFKAELRKLRNPMFPAAVIILKIIFLLVERRSFSLAGGGWMPIFMTSIADYIFPVLVGILFVAMFIGIEFVDRTINKSIYEGMSRGSIVLAKFILFIAVCSLISLAEPIILCIIMPKGTDVGGEYVLRVLMIKILALAAIYSLIGLAALIFRDVIKTVFAQVAAVFVLARFQLLDLSVLYRIFQPDAGSNLMTAFTGCSAAVIVLSVLISYILFRYVELK